MADTSKWMQMAGGGITAVGGLISAIIGIRKLLKPRPRRWLSETGPDEIAGALENDRPLHGESHFRQVYLNHWVRWNGTIVTLRDSPWRGFTITWQQHGKKSILELPRSQADIAHRLRTGDAISFEAKVSGRRNDGGLILTKGKIKSYGPGSPGPQLPKPPGPRVVDPPGPPPGRHLVPGINWAGGPTADLALQLDGKACQVHYRSAHPRTIRHTRKLGAAELRDVAGQMAKAVTATTRPRAGASGPTGRAAAGLDAVDRLAAGGKMLFNLLALPHDIVADMRARDVYLHLDTNEPLVDYPWELTHDGDDFLCLKDFVGRFISGAAAGSSASAGGGGSSAGKPSLDAISVLVIEVASPLPREDGTRHEHLEAAAAEARAIEQTLGGVPGVRLEVMRGDHATWENVTTELGRPYDIVHFCGHACFDQGSPEKSSLVLHDRDLSTDYIGPALQNPSPILCFINACESARADAPNRSFNLSGLASVFLGVNSYLLGTRWNVSDAGAAAFAKAFYGALLRDGKSLGEAVRDARLACRDAVARDDLAWASYVLYGAPRLCFLKKA